MYTASGTVSCKEKVCELHARLRDRFVKALSQTSVVNYVRTYVSSRTTHSRNRYHAPDVGSAQSLKLVREAGNRGGNGGSRCSGGGTRGGENAGSSCSNKSSPHASGSEGGGDRDGSISNATFFGHLPVFWTEVRNSA